LRAGDALVVWKLDRLARSMKQLIETVDQLKAREIGFRSLTNAGLKAALARGRKGGRRPKVKPDDVRAALALLNDPDISVRGAAAKLGLRASRPCTATPQGCAAAWGRSPDADPPGGPLALPDRLARAVDRDPLQASTRCCEHCGRPHGKTVVHLGDGRWWDEERQAWRCDKGRAVRRLHARRLLRPVGSPYRSGRNP